LTANASISEITAAPFFYCEVWGSKLLESVLAFVPRYMVSHPRRP